MSFLKSAKTLLENLSNRFSAAVDEHTDPKDKIKAAVRHVEEQAPKIKDAFSGVIAHYNELVAKEARTEDEIAEIKSKMARARDKQNDKVGMILAQDLVAKESELKSVKAELVTAAQAAKNARSEYEKWQKKVVDVQHDAAANLDKCDQAEAREAMNSAMETINTSNPTGDYAAASAAINDRLARAEAATELATDPSQKALDEFEAQAATDDAAAAWTKFKDEGQKPAAV